MHDQDGIDYFIAEMLFQGHHAWQCPHCLAAIWLEGMPLMLMRMGTIHQDECEACIDGINKVTEGKQ